MPGPAELDGIVGALGGLVRRLVIRTSFFLGNTQLFTGRFYCFLVARCFSLGQLERCEFGYRVRSGGQADLFERFFGFSPGHIHRVAADALNLLCFLNGLLPTRTVLCALYHGIGFTASHIKPFFIA